MKKIVMSLAIVTSMLVAGTALAQEENACDGVVSILRISNYLGTGSETGLRDASAKHDAWYKSHGVTKNKQVVIPLLEYDMDTDSFTKDTSRVATLHLNSVASASSRDYIGDNAWNEFIALYNENTEVTESVIACLPKSLFSQ